MRAGARNRSRNLDVDGQRTPCLVLQSLYSTPPTLIIPHQTNFSSPSTPSPSPFTIRHLSRRSRPLNAAALPVHSPRLAVSHLNMGAAVWLSLGACAAIVATTAAATALWAVLVFGTCRAAQPLRSCSLIAVRPLDARAPHLASLALCTSPPLRTSAPPHLTTPAPHAR